MKSIFHFLIYIGFFLFLISASGSGNAFASTAETPLVIENAQVRLECDPAFGTFARILDKASGIDLAPAASTADNFRLVLVMPDKNTATILGKDQRPSKIEQAEGHLSLFWDGPLRDTAGTEHKITVRLDITAVENALSFTLHCENGTDFKIREVLYPLIGGLSKFGEPGKPADGILWAPTSNPWIKKIDPAFGSPHFAYPGQMCLSFTCIESPTAGKSLYFASQDKIARYKNYDFDERMDPNAKEGSKDLFASIEHHPFTLPGKSFDGSTVVLRVIDGDWHAAGKVYRNWYEKTFGISKPADNWIRRESFFLITMFELPEGTICLRFKDIPQWAKEAKDHGINSVQISGWQHGGHDNGYPDYTPDPRLGTWQELAEGIKACHALGVKVYFFANYQQVMIDSDWYKKELSRYREWGPNGEVTWNVGWGMGTLWARMDHPKRMTGADPAFAEYRKIIVDQFAKLAEIGADGVHVDKMFPAAIDYNPNLPMSPDSAGWEGAILLSKEIYAACRKHNPEWSMSFECNWDGMLQFSGATWWVGNQLITRKVFPENAEAQVISSAYDYLGINNLVRDGHVVMLAPKNFARGMGWKAWEGLADYIQEVKRIRDELQDTVFEGEVLSHEGAIIGDSPSGVEYNVFRNLVTGKRVCIFTNSRMENSKLKFLSFGGSQNRNVRVYTPYQKAKTLELPADIEIPAERIVFVEEQ